jgi:hypothetical protein
MDLKVNKIILNDQLISKIMKTLKEQILIKDLSTYPEDFLLDIADYENIPDLIETKYKYQMYWRIYNSSDTVKLYSSLVRNGDRYEDLYTVKFLGSLSENIFKIIIPRHYINRAFYNTSAALEHEVTPSNANFITSIAKLFKSHKDFVMLQKYGYAIINRSYIKIFLDNENVLSSQYVEKYILTIGSTTVSTSSRIDFTKGFNEALSEKHTQELFGKDFLKLTKKELKLFEMYLE